MKNLLMYSLFAFATAGAIVSCKQGPDSISSGLRPMSTNTSSANPAITYPTSVVKSGTTYSAIAVMDTDGTHQNVVLQASGTETMGSPCWSPAGGSLAYQDANGGSSLVQSVKAMDISVNSSGKAVSSNIRSIYSTQNSDTATVFFPAWCSNSATRQIAFVRRHGGANANSPHLGLNELCTVSDGGGTPTVLASYQKLGTRNGQTVVEITLGAVTWSPDDSKIAVVRSDTNGTPTHNTIMIFDASTGAALDSIPIASNITGLEWSRTGMNKLVFTEQLTGYIYYCDPTTGSTPSTNTVVGISASWSPNNSSVMYTVTSPASLKKNIPLTSTTSTVLSGSSFNGLKWKR